MRIRPTARTWKFCTDRRPGQVAGRRRHAVRDGRYGTLDVDNKSVVPAGLRGRRPDPSSPDPSLPPPLVALAGL